MPSPPPESPPSPPDEPFAEGDSVRVDVASDDVDQGYDGERFEVVAVMEDGLDTLTGYSLDRFSYQLADPESGRVVSPWFRHRDLVPADDQSESPE